MWAPARRAAWLRGAHSHTLPATRSSSREAGSSAAFPEPSSASERCSTMQQQPQHAVFEGENDCRGQAPHFPQPRQCRTPRSRTIARTCPEWTGPRLVAGEAVLWLFVALCGAPLACEQPPASTCSALVFECRPDGTALAHHRARSCPDASTTRQLAGARNLRARGPSLLMAPSWRPHDFVKLRQARSISTVWLGSGSIHLTRGREISHFEALAESRESREMSPLRQSARVARGLSIEPSNIDSGALPTSAEPRASPDREICPLSEPLSSLPASGWSI